MWYYLWSVFYVIVLIWLITRLLAWLTQWLLQRYGGVLVKIGSVGLFSCKKVQIVIKKGLSVEIEKAWLSSVFFNQDVKKPVVICIQDIRVQADVHHEEQGSTSRPQERKSVVTKLAYYSQFIGLKISNLTVMLLNTMIQDCLVHVKSDSMNLDITVTEGCYQVTFDVDSVKCQALRSAQTTENTEPCLAEVSWNLIHLKAVIESSTKIKSARLLIEKPQAMMTEAFLTSLQDVRRSRLASALAREERLPRSDLATNIPVEKMIPNELGVDVTDLHTVIVRDNKQRTLSISLKMFHTEFFKGKSLQEVNTNGSEGAVLNIIVDDFHTKSPQARFADLLKMKIKCKLGPDSINSSLAVNGGYFHYHHDEVQYWSSIVSRFSEAQATPQMPVISNQSIEPSLYRKKIQDLMSSREVACVVNLHDVSSAVSSAVCTGLHVGVQSTQFSFTVFPGVTGSVPQDFSCQLEVQTVYCQPMESTVTPDTLNSQYHYWDHPIYTDKLLVKMMKSGSDVEVTATLMNGQFEWSSNTINVVLSFLSSLQRSRSYSGEIILPSTSHSAERSGKLSWKFPTDLKTTAKFEATNTNLFITNNYKVGLMLRIDNAVICKQSSQTDIAIEGVKVIPIQLTARFMELQRSNMLNKPALHIQEVAMVLSHTQETLDIKIRHSLSCHWETSHHMCVIQALEDTKELTTKLTEFKRSAPVLRNSSAGFRTKINIAITAKASLTLKLARHRTITLTVGGVVVKRSQEEVLMEIKSLVIHCDMYKVFHIQDILFASMDNSFLKKERSAVGNLTLETNRSWNISFESFKVLFPFNYNFAECFEEFVNLFKWWKLVHKIQRKPFTVDSKLPPDLVIKAKLFMVQLCDDPFEVKLGDNYDLLKDECNEGIKRRKVLDQKIQESRSRVIIPADKLQELYASLDKKSSEIYIQRSRQLYQQTLMRRRLFTWTMEDLEIIALADLSFHGKDNVVKHMKEIDTDSPYPAEGLEFLTLWCRMVNVGLSSWLVTMRDYPQPWLDVKDMHLWGRLIGAEQEGLKRAKRSCTVSVGGPWGDMTVERNLPALKFYHDFSCDIQSWIMAYGSCWEPAMAQFNLSMDLVNKPSVDPSWPLPWWDKVRLLFHGRLTMSVKQMSWLYHASLDPYNTTELMDWSWTNLILDWTNARFRLRGDLDIYARTASKYDDCKLLHLPNLSLSVKLGWISLGGANDHHSVMPCAPDKVPEYSLEEHDSFRAFRSKNLNLEISMDTKPLRDNTLNLPSCLFYASTLKFLDKIGTCLASVTRPIKRGAIFKNTKPKKIQLTRHYKTIKLDVNLHRFNICYWMSFSKQHGQELLAHSFVLHSCNDLTLVPIVDGLFHRPAANWCVRYLSCDLTAAKVWLQSARQTADELNVSLRNPVEKKLFITVSKVTYKRCDITTPKTESDSEDDEPGVTKQQLDSQFVHNLHVYGMKGAWTKHNRNVLIGLYDSYQKAQSLRRNLAADALKAFKVEEGASAQKNRSFSMSAGHPESPTQDTPPAINYLHILEKLVAESDSKSVVFTEEPSSSNLEQLHGKAACMREDDIKCRNWLIELHNSQVVLKGVETDGHVIVSAAKAEIMSYEYQPVWQNQQVHSKTAWVSSIECMQYYATVDPGNDLEEDCYPWLSQENVEDRWEEDLSGLPEMMSSGHSVGGIVYSTIPNTKKQVQLQRIISRCKCQIFFASYGKVGPDITLAIPPPPTDDSDIVASEEAVDTFTLLHHDLNICTNFPQYQMILDIVNNLLLHVEQKQKETTDKLQDMRFQLQLSKTEDQKTPIQQTQENLREQCLNLRRLEKELYLIHKGLDDDEDNEILMQQSEELELQLFDLKENIYDLNEELSMRISCFKESQLQVKALQRTMKAQQVHVSRRNEVCFKFAQWRLTREDGQLGITDLMLRNFVYTKVNRDNDTWTHQLELGWVKMTNLLPNTMYKDVLVPLVLGKENDLRQMALRIICSERPPVGGIAVKEHFEVNVVPLQIQMTYQFYKTVMEFFFPDKNIETDGQDGDSEKALHKKKVERKPSVKRDSVKKASSSHNFAEIDKMKERASNNNTFVYVKIPEVSLRVSYKGEKEKNIADIHDFSIVLPTMEYHNQIWTWFDLLMAIRGDTKRVILSQAIKQKLHMKSRVGEESPLTDVEQEEDKKKMLLGAKVLAGQEKPTKKGIFGKSQKK
ncbi:protein hobbit-like isoform X2 [Ostrea edulis]|uniref:protein hobbit-like isoform X2 n=1 Tax=Ostrea edulis TaxID=37623 RepID=UPI0024AFA29E|nr:protein hobbit-like isoform X2 [Ostrea edulis]